MLDLAESVALLLFWNLDPVIWHAWCVSIIVGGRQSMKGKQEVDLQ